MSHSNRNISSEESGGNSTLGMFLALYLILLGFFIVLTALSEPSTNKSSEVMKSVNSSFKELATETSGEKVAQNDFPAARDDNFLRAVNERLKSSLNIEGRFGSEGGNVLRVAIDADQLFARGSLILNREKQAIIQDILEPFEAATRGSKELFILYGIGTGILSADETRPDQFAVMRSESLRKTIEQTHGGKLKFTSGLVKEKSNTIFFVFRHKQPVSLRLSALSGSVIEIEGNTHDSE
ncbi:hypothetical protein QGN29_08945 [Temperatibacter marinus]|uniref:Motility protein B-like N-terminal domain-containing protein n=1 Tax=Temperatibacter marinus TaxID=1456591 RepID=A0AA52H9H3_9PROT|nr:hypothetical protein [Temperatibacter marinus]WND01685.1 hypothetical protein QGN29_08945 [Temperatibacter marinus]